MGRWHARELGIAGGSLVAVADLDEQAAQRLAARHGDARAYGDVERMLAQASPQVVHVCTPTESHLEVGESVLRAGAHLLVEKPVAASLRDTERLLELADARGLLVCPVHQYLFQPPLRELDRLLHRISPLVHVSSTACSAGGADATEAVRDQIADDILPHPLGVLERILPGGVAGLDWQAARPRPGELTATTVADSVGVSICVSMAGRPTRNELVLTGERGTLRIDFFHGYALVEPGAVSRLRKVLRPFALGGSIGAGAARNLSRRALLREPAYPGLRSLIEAVYAFAQGRAGPPIRHQEALAVARARERLLEASASNV
jgi:predicted dehydrogenase